MGVEQSQHVIVVFDIFANDQENMCDVQNIEPEKANSVFMSIEARTAGHGDLLSMIEIPLENGDNVESIFMNFAKF